jgi:hypothetical protein
LEGGSAALAFYWAFSHIGRGLKLPLEYGVTGAISTQSGEIQAAAELGDKSVAAREGGIHRLYYPLHEDSPSVSSVIKDPLLVGIDARKPAIFVSKARRRSLTWHVLTARILYVLLFASMVAAAIPISGWFAVFPAAAEGVEPWFEFNVKSELLSNVTYASLGLPVMLLLFLWPFLLFILVYWALGNQIECLVNKIWFKRWEPGLSPAGVLGSDLTNSSLSVKEQVLRRIFRFLLYWAAWAIGSASCVLIFNVMKGNQELPKDASTGRTILYAATMIIMIVAIIGAIALVAKAAKMFRRRINRKYPFFN